MDYDAPLDEIAANLQVMELVNEGFFTMPLSRFVQLLPVSISHDNSHFPTLYRLIEEFELAVYRQYSSRIFIWAAKRGKVFRIKREVVSSIELVKDLKDRQKQGVGKDGFHFWKGLPAKGSYIVFRSDVATAYRRTDKLDFPWHSVEGKQVSLKVADYAVLMPPDLDAKGNDELKLWLVPDPRDPQPEQDWYTPARYFARQLVEQDTTLLTKLDSLADKVRLSLNKVGIYKRGGKKSFSSGTIKKAFVNVKLG